MLTILILIAVHPAYTAEHDIITRQNVAQIAQLAVLDTLKVRAIDISPIDDTLLVATETDLWRYTLPDLTATHLFALPPKSAPIKRIRYNPDAQYITWLDNTGVFHTLDATTQTIVITIEDYKNDAFDFDSHPTHNYIAFVTRSGWLGVFDAVTGEQIQYSWSLVWSDLMTVAFSPTGDLIGTGSWDDLLVLYRYVDETEPDGDFAWWRWLIFTHGSWGHAQDVTAIAFHPNGQYVLSGGFSILTAWDMIRNGHAHTVRFENWIEDLLYTHNADVLIAADADGILWCLDAETYDILAQFSTNADWIHDIALTRDGRYVISAAYDYTLQVWGVSA